MKILALFADSPGQSFTATQVYQYLIATDPDINVTSIYRIVRSLHNAALLECEKGSAGYGGGKNQFRLAAGMPASQKITGTQGARRN